MKLKGINPIEQHVEKLVLGLVAVVLLGVIAMQFVLSPNNVDVGSGRSVPPQNIYVELESEAQRLQGQINDPDPTLPEVGEVDLAARYNDAMAEAGQSEVSLAAALGGTWDPIGEAGVADAVAPGGPIAGLVVPPLDDTLAVSQWISLDPFEVAQNPELADLAGTQQPYDVAGVSVQGTFNGGALLGILTDGVNGGRAIPRKFWRSPGITVLAVEAERQRRNADGTWSTVTESATPLPGAEAPAGALAPGADLTELLRVVRAARQDFASLIQPDYLPAVAGLEWLPPTEAMERADREANAGEADRIRDRIAELEAEIEEVRTGRPGRTTTRPDPGSRDPGSRPTTTRPSTRDDNDRNQRSRDRRIERLEEQIEELRTELEDLGFEDEEPARGTRTPRRDDPRSRDRRDGPSADDLVGNSIPIWTHDVGVEPGATYRYRLRVVVNNPLFGREQLLDPDDSGQQALAAEATVTSDWSSWTAPVTVPPRRAYFVTAATDASELGGGEPRASVELYEIYYGHYRRAVVSMGPGDSAIGNTALPDSLLLVDPALATRDALRSYFTAIDRLSDPEDVSAEPLPAGVSRAPAELSINLDAALLDVTRSILTVEGPFGRAENPLEAVFRLADGSVIVRDPLADAGDLYAQVAGSARAGAEAQLRFTERAERRDDPTGTRPIDPRDPRFTDPRDPFYPDDGP